MIINYYMRSYYCNEEDNFYVGTKIFMSINFLLNDKAEMRSVAAELFSSYVIAEIHFHEHQANGNYSRETLLC